MSELVHRFAAANAGCVVEARVGSCRLLCGGHHAADLLLPAFPPSRPGQFVQLLCGPASDVRPVAHDWPPDGFPSLADPDLCGPSPFLRRPFSIADRWTADDGSTGLRVIWRNVGVGTRWLEGLRAGQKLNVLGPLGRGFDIPQAQVSLVLVGGGVGIPPLLYLARQLHDLGWTDVTTIFGIRTRAACFLHLLGEPARDGTPTVCVELPGPAGYPSVVTSDDGSLGYPGRASDGLLAWWGRRAEPRGPAMVMACGPEPMLQEVARLTRKLGLDCQLCIERTMGCGLGTCLSCVVRVRDPRPARGWRWALTCQEGPVFPRDDLLDYGPDCRT